MEDETPGRSAFAHAVPVRIRDIDFAGHAHHSAALLYFEEARAAYWRSIAGQVGDLAEVGYVLGAVGVRYRERILYPDTLTVTVRVVHLGRKHFEMEYDVHTRDGSLAVTGTSTQVMYDYREGEAVPIPDRIRTALTRQDGPFDRHPAPRSTALGPDATG